ncbi:MAG: ABC transporter substrate-binding protein [Thermoplasmataceae archaeon]
MRNKKIALLSVLVSALVLLSPLPGTVVASADNAFSNTASSASLNQTINVGWFGTFIDTLNPFTSYSELTNWINMNVYLPLVNYDPVNHSVLPALASSWDVNYTNHTVIFHLNPNAVWSNGQPVTAQDVNLTYHIAEQNYTFVSQYTGAIQNITILNQHTIMFKFTGVLWTMFAAYIYVVPYSVWSHVNPATYNGYNNSSSQFFVGDGPFLLTKYVVNQYAEIQRNPDFFIPSMKPSIGGVIFEEFDSESSAISSLQAGYIQGLSGILPSDISQFANKSNYVVTTSPSLEYFYLAFNVAPYGKGNPTLRNLSVRQAIAHAINLPYITQTVFHGYASLLDSVLSPTNLYYASNLTNYSYNPSLADKLLSSAGFNNGSNGYRVGQNGNLSYTVIVPSGDTLEVEAAQLIADNLSKVGIKLTVSPETTGTMASQIWPDLTQDMDLWDWFDNIQSAPELLSVFLSNQVVTGTSDSGFDNSTYDNLWNETLAANSVSEVKALSYQMQVILRDQLPYLPLFVPDAINVYSSGIYNVSSAFPGGPFGGTDFFTFVDMKYTPPTPTASHNIYYYAVAGVLVILAASAIALSRRRKRNE